MSSFVEGKLALRQLFDCPSCNSPYDEHSVFFLSLSIEEQERLIQINLQKQVEANQQSMRHCPDEQCKLGVIRLAASQQKTGTCEECLREYCLSCMLPAHPGKCADTGASLLRKQFNFKECPKCKRVIERVAGCPHMKCPCGKEFCYNCLGDWQEFAHQCPEGNSDAENARRREREEAERVEAQRRREKRQREEEQARVERERQRREEERREAERREVRERERREQQKLREKMERQIER